MRTRRPASNPQGVWRATISRVDGSSVWVTVPRLSAQDFGPVEIAQGVHTAGLTTDAASGHVHPLLPSGQTLAVGNRVLVAFIEGRPNDLVVIARL